jgi:hypothetical protein
LLLLTVLGWLLPSLLLLAWLPKVPGIVSFKPVSQLLQLQGLLKVLRRSGLLLA